MSKAGKQNCQAIFHVRKSGCRHQMEHQNICLINNSNWIWIKLNKIKYMLEYNPIFFEWKGIKSNIDHSLVSAIRLYLTINIEIHRSLSIRFGLSLYIDIFHRVGLYISRRIIRVWLRFLARALVFGTGSDFLHWFWHCYHFLSLVFLNVSFKLASKLVPSSLEVELGGLTMVSGTGASQHSTGASQHGTGASQWH